LLVIETTIAFVVTLAILIIVHEFGHFMASKLVGVRVEEFALGFGPRLVTLFRLGDTDYTIHPIPAGGFVKLTGMEPGEDDEDPHGFNAQPIWKRFLVIFAGPFMSFMLAYVVFCSLGSITGLPTPGVAKNVVGYVTYGSPAERVGLEIGDKIISIDGHPIRNGEDLQGIVFKSAGKALALRIQRDERVMTVRATPELKQLGKKKVGLIGIILQPPIKKYGVVTSIGMGTRFTWEYLKSMYSALSTSEGRSQVGGVVGIARATAEGVKQGPNQLVLNMAALSLSLAVMNILPWPILDGGHILLLAVELVRRRKLTIHQMQVFQTFGLVTIVLLAVFLVYVDLAKWVPLARPMPLPK
jgi:regulator of sigma E protease